MIDDPHLDKKSAGSRGWSAWHRYISSGGMDASAGLLIIGTLGVVVGSVFLLASGMAGDRYELIGNVFIVAGSATALLIHRFTGRVGLALDLMLAGVFVSICAASYFSGGLAERPPYWLLAMPMVASGLGFRRRATFWMIASCIVVFALYLMERGGYAFPPSVITPLAELTEKIFVLIIFLVSFFVVYTLNDASRRRAILKLNSVNEELRVAEEAAHALSEQLEQRVEERTRELTDSEEQLRQSRESLENAQRIAHVGSFELNIVTGDLHWSPEVYGVFGLDPGEFVPTDDRFIKIVHPEDRMAVEQATNLAITEGASYAVDHRVVRPAGEIRYVQSRGEVERRADGTPEWLRGTVQDVTDAKQAEEKVRTRDVWLRGILDNTPIEIVLKDTEGRVMAVSRNVVEAFGGSEEELIGGSTLDFLPASVAERYMAADRCVVETGESLQQEIREEIDGVVRYSLNAKFPLKDAQGEITGVCSLTSDITEMKETEVRLSQAQKMEAVGQLTSGIAHDFNNVLAVVMGNLDLAMACMKEGSNNQEFLSAAMQGAQRGADLNRQLLTFSRQQGLEERVLNVNEIIYGMSGLLERTLGEDIEIETVFSEEHCFSKLDPTLLESAILNLAINARDAMPRGGKLRIETGISLPHTVANDADTDTEMIRISVSDSGSGMSAEVKKRALEPFYTTKEVGAGSGLGLSMVYGFVVHNGGRMEIDSEPGKGTTIHIILPFAGTRGDVLGAVDTSEMPMAVDGEVILVVEDQRSVRDVVVRQLGNLGYEVLEAEDGNGAVKILQKIKSIDLILSDMVLPGGLSGEEVVSESKAILPDVKSLYMSGNPLRSDDDAGKAAAPILRKPFRKADLARAVRDCLD